MSTPRILITGAAGFVGSHLVEYLQAEGFQDIFGTTMQHSSWLSDQLGEKAKEIDLTNLGAVQELLSSVQPDWIVHLAGIATVGESFENAWPILETNLRLQFTLLEAMRAQRSQARFLSISSAGVYGISARSVSDRIQEDLETAPDSPYAVSKLNQEQLGRMYARAYGLQVITVRPFNQIGPRQTDSFAVPSFAQQVVKVERGEQKEILVGNLEAIRDFTDVRDAAVAYRLLLEKGEVGEVYNLGSGNGTKMQEVLDTLISLAGGSLPTKEDPDRLRPSDMPRFVANPEKLQALGWQPQISLSNSLRDILEYERTRDAKK